MSDTPDRHADGERAGASPPDPFPTPTTPSLPLNVHPPGVAGVLWHWLRRSRGPLTFALGLVLVAAALWVVLRDPEQLRAAADGFAQAPWWLVVLGVILPAMNLVVVSVAFWALTRRFGPVGVFEMGALITGAWLINHLPMRAGMVGRLTYHKAVNRIPLKSSVRVVIEGVVLSVIAIAASMTMALWADDRTIAVSAGLLSLPFVIGAVPAAVVPRWWPWVVAYLCRYLDALIWAGRYAVVFAVVGAPIGYIEAVFLAAITQIVGLLPVSGNGLGVREWTVGVTAGLFGAAGEATGIAADLINRGAELMLGVPLGLIATAWVARRIARHRAAKSDPGMPSSTRPRAANDLSVPSR